MKQIYIIAGLLFLASCGNAEVQETKTDEAPATPETVVEQTVEVEGEQESNDEGDVSTEIDAEVEVLETAQEDMSKTSTLDAAYSNPRGPVDMKITYTTDSQGIITAINVAATTYDLTQFNDGAQSLVGSTLEDATEYYKSGSSLTGYAFRESIKAEVN